MVTNRYLRNTDEEKVSFFRAIREREILLHHPYESFSTSVQEFLAQAAADPKVLAIKQTLYRTSGDSPIVDALIDAAEAGKQVLALVEIKARFDEQNNITWARKLEQAGVHVVYGIVGLKTRFYEDFGLLTSREQVGEDLTRLFNQLSGFAPDASFKALLVSPNGVREGLTERIEREVGLHQTGKPAGIQIKVNSLVDEQIIDSLYKASQAGVSVDILVRGMCAAKPGVPGLSENMRVRSVLGRYLEHSRIFHFVNDGDPEIFIGSADMMHRNLDRRVEALVRIVQPDHIKELQDLFTLALNDTTSSWHLESSGTWIRHQFDSNGKKLIDMQDEVMRLNTLRKAK